MFPARVGMNRIFGGYMVVSMGVPRASGDEPTHPTTDSASAGRPARFAPAEVKGIGASVYWKK